MTVRQIIKTVTGRQAVDGAGVHLVRVLGYGTVKDFDPFLMLDAFDSVDPADYVAGFPMHPHRGIETVTYLVDGRIEHQDSLGNSGAITSGGCQWMTAGSGILHQEMPIASPRMLGLQLWINLPSDKKMTSPAYRDITPDMVPRVDDASASVAVVAGEYNGERGGLGGEHIPVTFLDVTVKPGQSWSYSTDPQENLFVYALSGECRFGGGSVVGAKRAVLFGSGDTFTAETDGGCRFILVSGRPLNEPVAWGGPIVMNTEDELRTAFDELERGTFIKSV